MKFFVIVKESELTLFFWLFAVSALLAVACAYDVYFLHGEGHDEVVYRYESDVRTAVIDPHVFASQFKLRGDLHIRNGKLLSRLFGFRL